MWFITFGQVLNEVATIIETKLFRRDTSLQIIRLDISRTFPQLGLFQADGPYHRDLHDLLAAYVSFQPSVGYLQGMSFIAAILLLVMDDILAAFIAFVSILNRDSFHISVFFCQFTAYFSAFDRLLETCLPRLHAHFLALPTFSIQYLFQCDLSPILAIHTCHFAFHFPVYSRSLPLEANLRVWDLFFRDGESALILAALGIMRMYEEKLLASDFDQLASFLTGPMPADMCPEELVSCRTSLLFITLSEVCPANPKWRISISNCQTQLRNNHLNCLLLGELL
ncbi:unnamed protein product [Schistocephalus solidus]|uniref:Rab-GAP TBC domain-containing protein n=1 Tax=Schistocephalus solidus TaxID=70667 RepID=A0A3P7DXL3_SCHSO|nr:unnamed protein product [Schistocephalus solidus]